MSDISREVPAIGDENRLSAEELRLLEQKIADQPLSFEQMRNLVLLSSQMECEYSVKIVKGENGATVRIIKQQQFSTDPFVSLSNLATKESDVCLTSHTHYKTNETGYNSDLSILLSEGDFENIIMSGSVKDEGIHLGSFFLPNAFGITFFVNSHKIENTRSIDFQSHWFLSEQDTYTRLGTIYDMDSNLLDLQNIIALTAVKYPHRIAFDLLFVPYHELARLKKDKNIDLDDILFGNGLQQLTKDTVFEVQSDENSKSLVDVIRNAKKLLRSVRSDMDEERKSKTVTEKLAEREKKPSVIDVVRNPQYTIMKILNDIKRKIRQ